MSGTCRNPVISLVAFEERPPSGFIFVKVPNERGRYVRVHKSVALVPCPFCKAVVGEPCMGGRNKEYVGYKAQVHWPRSLALKELAKTDKNIADQVDDLMPKLPGDVLCHGQSRADGMKFMDIPVKTMTRDDLLAVVGHIGQMPPLGRGVPFYEK